MKTHTPPPFLWGAAPVLILLGYGLLFHNIHQHSKARQPLNDLSREQLLRMQARLERAKKSWDESLNCYRATPAPDGSAPVFSCSGFE